MSVHDVPARWAAVAGSWNTFDGDMPKPGGRLLQAVQTVAVATCPFADLTSPNTTSR